MAERRLQDPRGRSRPPPPPSPSRSRSRSPRPTPTEPAPVPGRRGDSLDAPAATAAGPGRTRRDDRPAGDQHRRPTPTAASAPAQDAGEPKKKAKARDGRRRGASRPRPTPPLCDPLAAELDLRLDRGAAGPDPDLPAGRRGLRARPAGAGGPGRDQRDRDRLRHQPQRLLGRRARLDAVHARDLGRLRGRRQRRRRRRSLQPRRRDLRRRQLPRASPACRPTPTARSSPTTTPTGTSARSSPTPAATPTKSAAPASRRRPRPAAPGPPLQPGPGWQKDDPAGLPASLRGRRRPLRTRQARRLGAGRDRPPRVGLRPRHEQEAAATPRARSGSTRGEWRTYAVDGDEDGRIRHADPVDSAATLARLIWSRGSLERRHLHPQPGRVVRAGGAAAGRRDRRRVQGPLRRLARGAAGHRPRNRRPDAVLKPSGLASAPRERAAGGQGGDRRGQLDRHHPLRLGRRPRLLVLLRLRLLRRGQLRPLRRRPARHPAHLRLAGELRRTRPRQVDHDLRQRHPHLHGDRRPALRHGRRRRRAPARAGTSSRRTPKASSCGTRPGTESAGGWGRPPEPDCRPKAAEHADPAPLVRHRRVTFALGIVAACGAGTTAPELKEPLEREPPAARRLGRGHCPPTVRVARPRPRGSEMPTYLMLTNLTAEGVRTLKNNPAGSPR